MKLTTKAVMRTVALALAAICVMTCVPFSAVASEVSFTSPVAGGIIVNENFDSSAVFSGGNFVSDESGNVYTIEDGTLKKAGTDSEILVSELSGASSLCITSEKFYCVLNGNIVSIDRETYDTEIVAESDAVMMYVSDNGDIYTLENDTVYKNGKTEFSAESISRFCPTAYGYIYSTGEFLSYTVYGFDAATGMSFLIADDVESWDVEKETLVIDFSDSEKMISVEDLWMGGALSDYNLYGTGDVAELLENVSGSTSVTVGGTVLTAEEVRANDVSELSNSYRKTLSAGAQNIIKRARQMYEIEWTPLADVYADSKQASNMYFKAGTTYQGIPYGQPVHEGAFVGFNATIDEFAAAVKNPSSKMYTTKGLNSWGGNRYCPYYSNDCSSFVSYSWGIGRTTTQSFSDQKSSDGSTGYKNMGKNIKSLEPGYAICTDGSGHIILIYDVEYDSKGNLLRVTTLEQVEPQMRKKVWGEGGNAGTLADLQSFINGTHKTNSKPYSIIKYMKMDSVPFKACSSSPIDNETYINYITMPISSKSEDKAASGTAKILKSKDSFEIQGWSLHTAGIKSFDYKVDSGSWKSLTAGYDSSIINVEYSRFVSKCDLNTFYGKIPMLSAGSHTVQVRATTKSGSTYTVANFNVNVVSSDTSKQVQLNYDNLIIAGNTYSAGGSYVNRSIKVSSPSELTISYNGWCVSSSAIKQFEYKVDDDLWKPLPSYFRNDVYVGAGATYKTVCTDCNAFMGGSDLSYLSNNAVHTYSIRAVTHEGDVVEITTIKFTVGNPPAATTTPSSTATSKPTSTAKATATAKATSTAKSTTTVKPTSSSKPASTSTTTSAATNNNTDNLFTNTPVPTSSAEAENVEMLIFAEIKDIGNNTLTDNAEVTVEEAESTDDLDKALETETKGAEYVIVDIGITDGGKDVTLTDTIELSIDIPEGYDEKATVLYIVSEDGSLSLADAVCADGKITFKAEQLGTIAIVNGSEANNESATPGDVTETPAATDGEDETDTETTAGTETEAPEKSAPAETDSASKDGQKDDKKDKDDDGDDGLTPAAIAGIVAGAVVLVGAAIAVILFILKKKKNKTV